MLSIIPSSPLPIFIEMVDKEMRMYLEELVPAGTAFGGAAKVKRVSNSAPGSGVRIALFSGPSSNKDECW